jgi:hypothetical protein
MILLFLKFLHCISCDRYVRFFHKMKTNLGTGLCCSILALDYFEKLKQEKTLANVTSDDNY